jgi:hypothetical protein
VGAKNDPKNALEGQKSSFFGSKCGQKVVKTQIFGQKVPKSAKIDPKTGFSGKIVIPSGETPKIAYAGTFS